MIPAWKNPKGPFREALERKHMPPHLRESELRSTLTSTLICLLGWFRAAFP